MKLKMKSLVATALVASSLAVVAPARAHVGVYIAGMSGVPISAAGATYVVQMSPGHGCSGPRTPQNPDGVYDTTSLEVFMPRDTSGKFLFDGTSTAVEPRAIDDDSYRATVKWIVDPANPSGKRVSSIVYDNFKLPAVNNGYAARDTIMLGFTIKLPTLAQVIAKNYTLASGTTSSATGVKVYLPTMQYCDVTGLGVGVQASTSTPAAVTATVDPSCVATDTIATELHDDWRTVGNTPSLTIGTATTTVFEIAGNAPTVPASVSETFCSVSGVHAKRDWSWTGKFEATLSGKGASRTLTIKVDDSTARAGRIYVMRNSAGQVIARVKANGTGDISTTVSGKKIVSGSRISLYLRNALIATDAA